MGLESNEDGPSRLLAAQPRVRDHMAESILVNQSGESPIGCCSSSENRGEAYPRGNFCPIEGF